MNHSEESAAALLFRREKCLCRCRIAVDKRRPCHRAIVSYYLVFWRRDAKRPRIMQQSENKLQSPNAVSMTGQRRRLWVNIETALGECHVFAQVYSRPSDGLVLGQRYKRLTDIEPALGCDADPTLNWNLFSRHRTFNHGWFNVGPPSTMLDQC